MAAYERFALILDSESAPLGRAAVRLIEMGIDVLYAADVDEAALLARQEAQRLGALLFPTGIEVARLEDLLERVCPQLSAGTRALVAVGPEASPERVELLVASGAQWRLPDPGVERELRYVTAAAMAIGHVDERRKQLRIPSQIETTVFMGRHRKDVLVYDLSRGGAYLAAENPFLEGSSLTIDIVLPAGRVVGRAEVRNANTADRLVRPDVPEGMGIAFQRLEGASEHLLRDYIEDWLDRFKLAS